MCFNDTCYFFLFFSGKPIKIGNSYNWVKPNFTIPISSFYMYVRRLIIFVALKEEPVTIDY